MPNSTYIQLHFMLLSITVVAHKEANKTEPKKKKKDGDKPLPTQESML